jgi:hypothetical protein
MNIQAPIAQGYHTDLALHTIGWKAFQDLCAQICEEVLKRTVAVYREAQDGGQDAVLLLADSPLIREGTVQCKYTSKVDQRLRVSDITSELNNVEKLVTESKAAAYYFMTNMGVDAPVAAEICALLRQRGVQEPYVLGKEWITQKIRESMRLRALVPRVYGLGDLSQIIDERCATQTKALLGHLMPSLKVYVPTRAHRSAVRILGEHKIVLLLGAPATGKSMLAAILATLAIDNGAQECLKCEGPLELKGRWNPNEPKHLFWVDDAFGPNQLREDYVDSWIEFMPKMKAALDHGNHFILTSRTHIWNEAKHKLGTRSHPFLTNGIAVVDLGSLSPEESQQILYNHIKAGKQSSLWKRQVKQHLQTIALERNFLPEIARRIGDPIYTAAIQSLPKDLITFVKEPQEFLKGTIRELALPQQAAMTLIFLSRSRLPVHTVDSEEFKLVAEKYGISVAAVAEALNQLRDSFLIQRIESGELCWGFVHPTFADAVSSILSDRPDLIYLYVKGTKIENLLSEGICEGVPLVRDAVVIPNSSFDVLINRLLELPDVQDLNERLFQFLNRRAPSSVLENFIRISPEVLGRKGAANYWGVISRRSDVVLRAKAHSFLLLDEDTRIETCEILKDAAINHLDVSFFDNEEVLKLFFPTELIRLTIRLLSILQDEIPTRIEELAENADPDSDIDDQFCDEVSFVRQMQLLTEDEQQIQDFIENLDIEIEIAKQKVAERKSDDESESFWGGVPSAPAATTAISRSIFSDVDE